MNMQSSFLPTTAILRTIVPMTLDNYLFQFTVEPAHFEKARPGQFVQLWIPGAGESPISLCSDANSGGTIELCVRRTGRVTDALFKMKEGDWVGLRGPYGNGWPIESLRGKNVLLVAGGLGIAPIRSLLWYILHHREEFGDLCIVYGMRHSIDLLFRHEMMNLIRRDDLQIYIGAEECEAGGPQVQPIDIQLGRVTDMLRLAMFDSSYVTAICGPPVMYPYVVKELKAKGVTEDNIYYSLERHMKCGVGKCGHCFIGGKLTCKQGPVFSLADLRFVPEVVECVNC